MKTDNLYIKDSSYYLGKELINISDFNRADLKIGKKKWKDLTVYHINYINRNKSTGGTMNQLYLSINNVSGYISEENGDKCLMINTEDAVSQKYNSVFLALKDLIASKEGKNINFNDRYHKIKFLSDTDLVLDKLLYFTELTVAIRCVFKKGDIFYP